MSANGGNNGNQEPVAAAPLSPEFLGGSTKAGLEKIRTRLLDLTNRNRLLNFRHTVASSIRVVDADLDDVFRRLIDGEKLTFVPVPEPDTASPQFRDDETTVGSAKPTAADYARSIGWRTSYDLEGAPRQDSGGCGTLPVLHYLEGLETLTRKIGSTARTAIEESGTNMLYLIFGFLEWYESDDSQQPRLAPLLTMPVSLERTSGRGRGFECMVEYSGEDLTINLSLAERMRQDFGLEIPALEEHDTPESYFARFSPLLRQKPRWRIRRQITLSLLSFGKLLMFRDLDPKAWPGIVQHPLVKELFEGRKSETITHAPEYPIDDPAIESYVPPLILDADSSQHSALIDAVQGKSLVIEGPPGTGKSQTIANLIAAALVNGKTVLFVSEKLAALEVVRRRLDDIGLGMFCLELHSHKTRKHALLKDLEARRKARGSFREPRELDQYLAAVRDRKRRLTRYAALINKLVEPFQATVFEVLWARDRYLQELPFAREPVEHLLLPGTLRWTRTQFTEALQFLSLYGNHLAGIQHIAPDYRGHPWAWVARSLGFDEEVRLIDLLTEFSEAIGGAIELQQALTEAAALGLHGGIRGLNEAQRFLARLPQDTGAVNEVLLASCRDSEMRRRLHEFTAALEQARNLWADLGKATAHNDPRMLLEEDRRRRVSSAVEDLQALGLDKQDSSALRNLLGTMREAEKTLNGANHCYAALQAILGSRLPFTTAGVECVLHCCRLIESAPIDTLHLRTASLETEGAIHIVRKAAEEARRLLERRQELDARFDLTLLAGYDISSLSEYATAIEDASLWQLWFGGSYRRAGRAYKRLSRQRRKETREVMGRNFRALRDYTRGRTEFETQNRCRELLGPNFLGLETQWEHLLRLLAWYEEIFVIIPEEEYELNNLLLRARAERLKLLKSRLPETIPQRDILTRLKEMLPQITGELSLGGLGGDSDLQELLRSLQGFISQVEDAVGAFTGAGLRDDVKVSEIPLVLNSCASYSACVARLSSDQELLAVPGKAFEGPATDLDPLKATLAFAESVLSGGFSPGTLQWILCSEGLAHTEQLCGWLKAAVELGNKLSHLGEEIERLTGSTVWPVNTDEPLPVLLARANRALASREELSQWLHFLRIRAESKRRGLDRLTNLAEEGVLHAQHLVPAFRFVFYNSLSRGVFAEHPDLSQFGGVTQDELRKQFAEADRKAIALYRERAAAIIDRRPVPYGNQSGPVGSWTELALITKEINKQKRHIPIRQLVRRAAGALQALKPCFMMGPLSVAQYLAPGEVHFDLIVMDEASQLKPEDAIGAVARGAQIVIVGDPKQLPPTTFFQRLSMDAGDYASDDDIPVVEEGESILDVASTLYQPVRRLRWHYRSRHHSLIAFSNREFYQGDLVIFPSAYQEDASLGVKYHRVSGVFENSRNPREAEIVADAVLSHMKDHSDESLGVVTLNYEQRDLIEEILDQKLRSDPFAMAYQERMNGGPEPFFIKNLENVQGDERDVIFISFTYGPDARGNQYMRFGPINLPNGYRRLNVLFTRAKKRTEVFSTLDPDKIHVTPGKPGLEALKKYLMFARSGVLDTPDDGPGPPSNDFEKAVGAVLQENGYVVVPQVGVAGFFIDLAVRHPAKPGTFLLGVECDGATYHSGRSVRDRDRLRQEILENLGWKIHRIWSTDWFRSREKEIKRLLARIEGLLANDPDYLREKQKAHRLDLLRARLVEIRDNEILTALPDSSPDKCLLRPDLLEEFIRRRPRSRDDWFRLIPHELRSGTDPKQVGRFLPKVLETINTLLDS